MVRSVGERNMTTDKLKSKIASYPLRIIHNKDCSEYAEDIRDYLGAGRLITFKSAKPYGYIKAECFGALEDFEYHTVLDISAEQRRFIVDMTAEDKIFSYKQYMAKLEKVNSHNINVYDDATRKQIGMIEIKERGIER